MGFYDIEWVDCYQISLLQTYLSQQLINRYFYKARATVSEDLNEIAEAWWIEYETWGPPIQSELVSYMEVRVLELFGTRQRAQFFPTGEIGDVVGNPLPAFFSGTWRLGPADTRIKKGRKALGGMTEAEVDGNIVNATFVAAFANFSSFLISSFAVGAATFDPVLLSPANTLHATDIVSGVASASWRWWSTQSSRKTGRGS
jgi:hypothetical protein